MSITYDIGVTYVAKLLYGIEFDRNISFPTPCVISVYIRWFADFQGWNTTRQIGKLSMSFTMF